jgi:hypothetical protein
MLPLTTLAEGVGYSVVVEPQPERYGGCCDPETHTLAINRRKSVNHRVKPLVHELGHMLFRIERSDDDPELSYSEEGDRSAPDARPTWHTTTEPTAATS